MSLWYNSRFCFGKKGIKSGNPRKSFHFPAPFKTQFYNCQLSTVINVMQVLLDQTELIPCVFSNAWTLNRPWIYCVSSRNMFADLSKRINFCNAVKEYCPAGLGHKHLLSCRWFFNQKLFKRIKLSRNSNLERWSQECSGGCWKQSVTYMLFRLGFELD